MKSLILSAAPHIRSSWTGQKIMKTVFLSLVPAAAAGILFFGLPALFVLFAAVLSAWLTDLLIQFVIKRHNKKYNICYINWSSLLTGLFLGLVLPPLTKIWIAVIGAVFAIALGKYAFGKGNNIFNPALIARVFLVLSFPALMAGWIIPDAVTQATPLTIQHSGGTAPLIDAYGSEGGLYRSLFLGNVGGSIGETSAFALLLGGFLLLALGLISFRIPLSYLGTVALLSGFFGRDILFDLLAGGLIIGAFFMATDYVTSPVSRNGQVIFGIGCGVLTMLLRIYSANPEGVAFSILLMNAAVPIIERYTR